MKKKVIIVIEIDTEQKGESSIGKMADVMPEMAMPLSMLPNTDGFVVRVAGGDDNGKYAVDSLAHELGHAISSIFNIPGGMNQDPRTCKEILTIQSKLNLFTANQMERIYSNEVLAWELAGKIAPIDPMEKARCLQTYYNAALEHGGLKE